MDTAAKDIVKKCWHTAPSISEQLGTAVDGACASCISTALNTAITEAEQAMCQRLHDRIKAWYADPARKPPQATFTAGELRDFARLLEDATQEARRETWEKALAIAVSAPPQFPGDDSLEKDFRRRAQEGQP